LAVPKQIPSVEPAIPAPEIGIAGTVGEANGSGAPGIVSLLDLVPAAPAPAPAELQPKSKPARQPVRFGGRVAEANLLRKVMPVYPPLAKSTRVQGTVEFTALISKGGNIENLQLVHGHPLLVQAAKEVVLQWKYRPTTLNGEAVEVITDIVVNFTLSQ
jgi:protein TonB